MAEHIICNYISSEETVAINQLLLSVEPTVHREISISIQNQ